MLRNYLKIAWRNLWKHKLFSFINIFGLASGMTVCLLALIQVKDAVEYDTFHPHADRTYRIITDVTTPQGDVTAVATSPLPLADALRKNYGFVEKTARVYYNLSADVSVGQKTMPANGAFADAGFYELFGFRLLIGRPAIEPRTVVLSQRTAERFFGKANPIGKIVAVKDRGSFTITGVLATNHLKSHLHFDLLASMASVPLLEQSRQLEPHLTDWKSHWTTSAYTYVLLNEGTPRQTLETALATLAAQGVKAMGTKADQTYTLRSQVLSGISPAREEFRNSTWEPTLGGLLAMGGLALVILVLAGFNYVNLTLARSLSRAREVGVRKVAGALRAQIVGQFMAESVLLSVLSLGLAYVFLTLMELLPTVLRSTQTVQRDATLWLYFVGFALLTGIVAGLVPARVLSNYQPVQVLRGQFGPKLFRGMGLRKGLMVAQFVVSLVFMVFVAVMYQQFLYMATASYGFDRENSLSIAVAPKNYRLLADKFAQQTGVERVAATSSPLGFHSGFARLSPDRNRNYIPSNAYSVDANFVKNMGLTLLAGQNMPPSVSDSAGRFVLLNEKAVTALKFKSAREAVGQLLWLDDSTEVQIAGVLKDFNYQNLSQPLRPLMLRYIPDEFHYVNIKVEPGAKASIIPALEQVWKQLAPHEPFTYQWVDDEIYNHHLHLDDLSVSGLLVFMALSIACLGLLGMVTYSTATRIKEVGIRKVMGATVGQLVALLSKDFVRLLLLAGVIALPLGYAAGRLFLHEFAHHIDIGVGILGACFAVMLLVGGLAIGWRTYRAAQTDPAKSLRTE
ncbi:ABC transporter permease [Spirosoma areae]